MQRNRTKPKKSFFKFLFSKTKMLFLVAVVVCLGEAGGASAAEWVIGSSGDKWIENTTFENTTVTYDYVELLNGWNPANEWWGTSGGTMEKINSASEKISIRFTSPVTKDVSSVGVVPYAPLNSPVYRIGLQTDDGTGNPDGSYIDGQYNTIQPTSSNEVYWGYFSSNITIIKDNVYHLVIEYDSGTIGASNYCSFKGMLNPTFGAMGWIAYNYNGYDPDVAYKDPNYYAMFYNGATWGPDPHNRHAASFVLNFADETRFGGLQLHNYRGVFGDTWCGERILIHNQDKIITQISTYFWIEAGVPDDDCYYEIQDSSHNILREGVLINKEEFSGANWWTVDLSSPITLEVGKVYYIIFKSPGSDYTGYYNHDAGGPIYHPDWSITTTYGGGDSYHVRSKNGGLTWTNYFKNDYSFRLKLIDVFKGDLTSIEKDAESIGSAGNIWKQIKFEGSVPDETNVDIEVNSSSCGGFVTVQNNTVSGITYDLPSCAQERYTSWRLILHTDDISITPEIYNITLISNVAPSDTIPPDISNGSPSGTIAYDTTQTNLTITTDENATCKYSTIQNTEYDSISNTFTTTSSTNHSTQITNLISGLSYVYYIRCIDASNNPNTEDYSISFTVASAPDNPGGGGGGGTPTPDIISPSKATNFTASAGDQEIILTWKNPTNSDYAGTKILRKEDAYPANTGDGELIYDGDEETYTDTILINNISYYYSAFTYDEAPNYSESATARATPEEGKAPDPPSSDHLDPDPEEKIYPEGALLKTPDSFKIYVVINQKKKWIPTPEVFETLGYQWGNITVLDKAELNSIPNYEDNLIRAIGNYKVYLVVSGISRHIPNPEIFLNYGFAWEDVADVPQATIDKYTRAYLIRESRQGAIYYLRADGVKKWIRNPEIFSSYNNSWDDVQVISKLEMDSYSESNLIQLSGDNRIYLIEGDSKRWISSAEVFNAHKFNWNHIITVNQAEFDFYKAGDEMK